MSAGARTLLTDAAITSDAPVIVDFAGGSRHPLIPTRSPRRGQRPSRIGLERALRTLTALQSTLDPEQLLRVFSREVANAVPHSSVNFVSAGGDVQVTVGRVARHARRYRLVVERHHLGEITFTRGKAFPESAARRLEEFLAGLVFPLRNAVSYRSALHASLTDPLTGVNNRSVLDSALRREAGLTRRHGTPHALVLMDVDRFKTFNDRYGHEAGDAILKCVTQTVSRCLRSTDLLARLGGDEFGILLSNTNLSGASILARNVHRRLVAVRCAVAEGLEVPVSVSVGVAAQTRDDGDRDLFAAADAALYRAKRGGRNRVGIERVH